MGSGSSKKNELPPGTQSDVMEVEKDNNCSKSLGPRMARGAFMAVNPTGALIARAIRLHKSHNKNGTTNNGC